MIATLSSIAIPFSYKQAMEHECWRNAMQVEMDALAANDTWNILSFFYDTYW